MFLKSPPQDCYMYVYIDSLTRVRDVLTKYHNNFIYVLVYKYKKQIVYYLNIFDIFLL